MPNQNITLQEEKERGQRLSPESSGLSPFLLSCSPRKNGNTDTAARLTLEAIMSEGPTSNACGFPILRRVADCHIHPCISCGYCETHPGRCSLERFPRHKEGEDKHFCSGEFSAGACFQEGVDEALELLLALCKAPLSLLISPIYFYHLPAQAKALLDRSQSFWEIPPHAKPGTGHSLGVILLGARQKGDNLFTGSMLSLRYMCEALGLHLQEPLLLYGLDGPGDLDGRPDIQRQIREYTLGLMQKQVSGTAR